MLPDQLTSHWHPRPGRRPGRELYHWHLLLHDQPAAQQVVADAQRKLAGLPVLDLVPIPWLHITTLIAGFADEVPASVVDAMTAQAEDRLARLAPIPVYLDHVIYDPEAVVLLLEPLGDLQPVLDALRAAAEAAGCPAEADADPWFPHLSIAYSNTTAPAAPVVEALGTHVPRTDFTITSATLVAQTQVERTWQWRELAEVRLGT
jgi:2'-5' RNA ligase